MKACCSGKPLYAAAAAAAAAAAVAAAWAAEWWDLAAAAGVWTLRAPGRPAAREFATFFPAVNGDAAALIAAAGGRAAAWAWSGIGETGRFLDRLP